jgi:hypothetical protein
MNIGEEKPPVDHDPHAEEKSSLRREFLAILVLYVAATVLPLVIGLAFGPESG